VLLFRALCAAVLTACCALAQPYDLVLLGGRVLDPASGLDALRHLGIRDSRIAAISEQPLNGRRTIDVRGLAVAPGFIDLHQHSHTPEAWELKARDGVTTALELEIGVSPLDPWYAQREGKAVIHYGASAGYIPARMIVMKDTGSWLPRDKAITETSTPADRATILGLIEKDLKEGGLGIGFGFNYTPKAGPEEIQEVFALAARYGRPGFVHMRYGSHGDPGLAASIHEVIAYAVVTGAPIHIVHLGASSTKKFGLGISMVEAARRKGLDISVESYPYTAGMTRLETAIFDPGWQERLGITYGDIVWAATGERLTEATFGKYRTLGGLAATFTNTEEMIRKNMAHPLVMVASDGIMENGQGHPRAAGTYARVLGKYVRQEKALSLIEAIRKMSLMPAQRLEKMSPAMARKGRIQVGADADLAVFDPATVIDRATYEKPNLPSAGIPYVLVGGVLVVDQGRIVKGIFPGRAIRAH
jgi:imidazolonepropionase-like amidohydrolase